MAASPNDDAFTMIQLHIRVPQVIADRIEQGRREYGESRSAYIRRALILLSEYRADKAPRPIR